MILDGAAESGNVSRTCFSYFGKAPPKKNGASGRSSMVAVQSHHVVALSESSKTSLNTISSNG